MGAPVHVTHACSVWHGSPLDVCPASQGNCIVTDPTLQPVGRGVGGGEGTTQTETASSHVAAADESLTDERVHKSSAQHQLHQDDQGIDGDERHWTGACGIGWEEGWGGKGARLVGLQGASTLHTRVWSRDAPIDLSIR